VIGLILSFVGSLVLAFGQRQVEGAFLAWIVALNAMILNIVSSDRVACTPISRRL